MSLNLLEFKNGHVNISSAAMPPVYHYSKKTDSVNEIELVGTPLGSFYDEEFNLCRKYSLCMLQLVTFQSKKTRGVSQVSGSDH